MDAITGFSFARPAALLLLLVLVPLTIYLSRTSMALLRPRRRALSLAFRISLVTILVAALAGAGVVRASDRLSVVFLLDHSDSVSAAARNAQAEYVRQAIDAMKQDDSAGVVVFGANALVDRPVSPDKTPSDLSSKPTTTYTNLAGALRLGLGILPEGTAQRLVLMSDGLENVDNAEWAAKLAAARGVAVDVVPLPSAHGPEVWVEGMSAPSPVREGERVSLKISVSSSSETTATLAILVDGAPLSATRVELAQGPNSFVQQLPPAITGFHTYEVQVDPAAGTDIRRENNSYSAFSLVLGKPHLLVVEGHGGESAALAKSLEPGVQIDVVGAAAMPSDLKSLAGYDGVVLINVPASSLPSGATSALQVAVRDLGKGLIVIGGDESYGAGGYFRTPLEEMLPVSLDMPSKLDIPSVGMVMVIDRSGSMAESHSASGAGVKKIELAKEAAAQAVAQLSNRDYAGVITFDSAADWVLPLQPLGDPSLFKSRIESITPGGGTNIYAGLAPAVDALSQSKARSKHIILLTDGVSEGGDYQGLLKKMSDNGITLSTVAVGSDADTTLMQSLAAAGKGQYYYTEDGNALPQIFAHESHIAAHSYLIEHPFTPARSAPSPIFDGLGALPALQGYVGTSPREGGQIDLVSDAGDPVLAQWQYGLGRVVAWTSDAKGQWAKEWVTWSDFARFWSQAVAWSTGAESSGSLQSHIEVEGGAARISVDALAPDGSYLNGLNAIANIVSPDNLTSTVALRQTTAGRYEGSFTAGSQGAYLVRVQATAPGAQPTSLRQTVGLVVPYSPEFRGDSADNGLLGRVAALTGGRTLSLDAPAAAVEHNLRAVQTTTDLWPLLVFIAVLLLPFDVGLRRVSLTRVDLLRALSEARSRLGWLARRRAAAATASTSAGDMAALFEVKSRVRRQHGATSPLRLEPDVPLVTHNAGQRAERDAQVAEDAINTRTPVAQKDFVLGAKPQAGPNATEAKIGSPPQLEGESLAARLRHARERRR